MVLVWIGIGLGILIAIILFSRILKKSSSSPITFNPYCKKCGYKTNGLKCPKCENMPTSNHKWK